MENTVDPIDTRGFTRSEKCYNFKKVERKRKGKTKERDEIREKSIEVSVPKA